MNPIEKIQKESLLQVQGNAKPVNCFSYFKEMAPYKLPSGQEVPMDRLVEYTLLLMAELEEGEMKHANKGFYHEVGKKKRLENDADRNQDEMIKQKERGSFLQDTHQYVSLGTSLISGIAMVATGNPLGVVSLGHGALSFVDHLTKHALSKRVSSFLSSITGATEHTWQDRLSFASGVLAVGSSFLSGGGKAIKILTGVSETAYTASKGYTEHQENKYAVLFDQNNTQLSLTKEHMNNWGKKMKTASKEFFREVESRIRYNQQRGDLISSICNKV